MTDVTQDPQKDEKLLAIEARAQSAGMATTWYRFRDQSGKPWLQVAIPAGRDVRPVDIKPEDAESFARYNFERWVALSGYNALLDLGERKIVSQVGGHDGTLHTIPGAEEYTGEVSSPYYRGDDAPSFPRPPTGFGLSDRPGSLVNKPITIHIEGSDTSLSATLCSKGINHDVHFLSGSHHRSTLQINNVAAETHDQAVNLLLQFSSSLFFELDMSYGIALQLDRIKNFDGVRIKGHGALSTAPKLPRCKYDEDAASLYLHARNNHVSGASSNPLVPYLSYYQVIEYYMPAHSRSDELRRLRNAIKDPRLDPDDDADLGRLLALVVNASRYTSEREQLKLTLNYCINESELSDFLFDQEEVASALADKRHITDVRTIQARDKNMPLVDQVAERVYGIRCRIVHSKDIDESRSDSARPLMPFSAEAERLRYDLALVQFLAQKVLIASGKTGHWG